MKKSILLAACFLMTLTVAAQNDTLANERDITLAEAIALARTQSVDAAVALNELKTAYWEYRTFRADLLPEVNFTGTLPNYNKSYSTYQNSDGSYSFVRNNTLDCQVRFLSTRIYGSQVVNCHWLLLLTISSSWVPEVTSSSCPYP